MADDCVRGTTCELGKERHAQTAGRAEGAHLVGLVRERVGSLRLEERIVRVEHAACESAEPFPVSETQSQPLGRARASEQQERGPRRTS